MALPACVTLGNNPEPSHPAALPQAKDSAAVKPCPSLIPPVHTRGCGRGHLTPGIAMCKTCTEPYLCSTSGDPSPGMPQEGMSIPLPCQGLCHSPSFVATASQKMLFSSCPWSITRRENPHHPRLPRCAAETSALPFPSATSTVSQCRGICKDIRTSPLGRMEGAFYLGKCHFT